MAKKKPFRYSRAFYTQPAGVDFDQLRTRRGRRAHLKRQRMSSGLTPVQMPLARAVSKYGKSGRLRAELR